jgi:hypothetical protein
MNQIAECGWCGKQFTDVDPDQRNVCEHAKRCSKHPANQKLLKYKQMLHSILESAKDLQAIVEGPNAKSWSADGKRLKDTTEWACLGSKIAQSKRR